MKRHIKPRTDGRRARHRNAAPRFDVCAGCIFPLCWEPSTYQLLDLPPPQKANVPAVRSGSTKNGQCNSRQIWIHPKRPTYQPFPGAGLGNLARVSRKRRPAGFLAKRTPERPKDGRLVPPLLRSAEVTKYSHLCNRWVLRKCTVIGDLTCHCVQDGQRSGREV